MSVPFLDLEPQGSRFVEKHGVFSYDMFAAGFDGLVLRIEFCGFVFLSV